MKTSVNSFKYKHRSDCALLVKLSGINNVWKKIKQSGHYKRLVKRDVEAIVTLVNLSSNNIHCEIPRTSRNEQTNPVDVGYGCLFIMPLEAFRSLLITRAS